MKKGRGADLFFDDEDLDDFWEGLEGDVTAAQKKAVEILSSPRGRSMLTLSDLSGGEIRVIATLKSVAEAIPDPVLLSFIRNYLLLKRSKKRRGVSEIISIVGGRAWKLLQNIHLSRIRRQHYEEIE